MSDRLHPEGAPGFVPALNRAAMGDTAYEAAVAVQERAVRAEERRRDAAVTRSQVVTCLLFVVLLAALVAAPIGLIWLARVAL